MVSFLNDPTYQVVITYPKSLHDFESSQFINGINRCEI